MKSKSYFHLFARSLIALIAVTGPYGLSQAQSYNFQNALSVSSTYVSPSQLYQVQTRRIEAGVAKTTGQEKLFSNYGLDHSSTSFSVDYFSRFNRDLAYELDVSFSKSEVEYPSGRSLGISGRQISGALAYSVFESLSLGLDVSSENEKFSAPSDSLLVSGSDSKIRYTGGLTFIWSGIEVSGSLKTAKTDLLYDQNQEPEQYRFFARRRVAYNLALGTGYSISNYQKLLGSLAKSTENYGVAELQILKLGVEFFYNKQKNASGQLGAKATEMKLSFLYNAASNLALGAGYQNTTMNGNVSSKAQNTIDFIILYAF